MILFSVERPSGSSGKIMNALKLNFYIGNAIEILELFFSLSLLDTHYTLKIFLFL